MLCGLVICLGRGLVVVLGGVDGSGKSVICRSLSGFLVREGFGVRVVWVKSLHTLAFLVYGFFRRFWGIEWVVNPCGRVVEHFVTGWMRRLGWLWGFLEFLSVLPWVFVVFFYRFLGFVVVCDRFLMDFLATVSLRVGDVFWSWKSLWGRFLRSLQRRVLTFHLRVSLKTALRRRPDVEYSLEEFKLLAALYRVLARDINAHEVLNENVSVFDVVKHVRSVLSERICI